MLKLIFLISFISNTFLIYSESMKTPGFSSTPFPNCVDVNIQLKFVDNRPICGENQIYDSCPPINPPRRCNVNELISDCGQNPEAGSPFCVPGCRCADFYYLNSSGDCITKEECLSDVWPPMCSPKSPGYSKCINGGCSEWRCTDYGYVCLAKVPCEPGCACKDMFKRSRTGVCMPEFQCPPSSGKPPVRTPSPQYLYKSF